MTNDARFNTNSVSSRRYRRALVVICFDILWLNLSSSPQFLVWRQNIARVAVFSFVSFLFLWGWPAVITNGVPQRGTSISYDLQHTDLAAPFAKVWKGDDLFYKVSFLWMFSFFFCGSYYSFVAIAVLKEVFQTIFRLFQGRISTRIVGRCCSPPPHLQ